MKNKIFSLCLIVFLGLFSFLNSLFAVGTDTVNGLTYTLIDTNGVRGVRVERLNAYALGTSGTYIYNGLGESGTTSGSFAVTGYEFKSASINITNAATDTVTVRPESQVGTTSFWINGTVTALVGTQTRLLTFTDPVTNLRWGFIKNGTNTATVTFFEEYTRYVRK